MGENAQISLTQRFTNYVVSAYTDIAKGVPVGEKERALIANYYIEIDSALATSKQGYTWKDINMMGLSRSVSHLCKLGLDMKLNHVSFLPFRNSKTGKVEMTSCISAKGWEHIVKSFSKEPVKNVIVELVYSTDTFRITKKDANHPYDNYVFEITNPFDRGTEIGGFAYCEFENQELNKLHVMSMKEILALKPQRADDTFWGKNSPSYHKMLEKTVAKQLLKKIHLDPDKVNGFKDTFDYLQAEEIKGASLEAREIIQDRNSNGPYIDFDTVVDAECEVVEPVEDENEVVSPEDDILGVGTQESLL